MSRPANEALQVSGEVGAALAAGRPVVALESTIISHGMPYPENVATALRVERIIRENGAIPATIAILEGKLAVGLSESQLDKIASGAEVLKVSRRDLPIVVAQRADGATTVAATMAIAAMAGIRVFVTGGIGGVHRDAQNTFDISADLTELARTSVAVVCAGAKAILDIGLTLEFLETHGVPVIGYRSSVFPAFYSRESGFNAEVALNTAEEIARVLHSKWSLGLEGGVVVANPIQKQHALPANRITAAISTALDDAKKEKVSGKAVTPYLLSRVVEITGGASLKANVELVCNNARFGAELALAYSKLQ